MDEILEASFRRRLDTEKSDSLSTGRQSQDGELSTKRKMYAAIKSAWGFKVKKKQNNNKNNKHIKIKKVKS